MNTKTILSDLAPVVTHRSPHHALTDIAVMAHGFRSPLSNIKLAVEMIQFMTIDEEQQAYIDIINRNVDRIVMLVNNLLLSGNTDRDPFEACSVQELLNEVLAINGDRLMLKNIVVCKDYAVLDALIYVNKVQMLIALSNIVINAIEAIPGEKGVLTITTLCTDRGCVIQIADNGIGIPIENQARIFEPYFTNKPTGMGVGLSATLDILLANQASVEVESEENVGSRFILFFERAKKSVHAM